jgi:NADH dehydrogenase
LVKFKKMELKIPNSSKKRVVIIGGGFGGIEVAKKLSGKEFQVVLLDKNNYHTFQPLLYQVATGGLEPGSIAYPLRKFMQEIPNGIFRYAEVLSVDANKKQIHTDIGELSYDYLIIATGSTTNFFNLPEETTSKMMQMKDIPQALDIRSFILQNYEEALLVDDLQAKQALLNIAIVGGGPTGVELAGAIGEMRRKILPKDYPELDFRKMEIHIFDATDRLLNAFSPENSGKALQYLKDFDVHVWLNTLVTGYDGKNVFLNNGKTILANTLIWAAGVKGMPIKGLPAEAIIGGRIVVDEFCKVKICDDIYAIGDVASMSLDDFPKGHPMVAPVAMQQGDLVAKNLLRIQKNKEVLPFKYFDKGSMATVGRNRAVMESKGIKMGGFIAWLAWLLVHVMTLIGFRNKLTVLLGWLYNYFTYDRTLRLIIRPFKKREKA